MATLFTCEPVEKADVAAVWRPERGIGILGLSEHDALECVERPDRQHRPGSTFDAEHHVATVWRHGERGVGGQDPHARSRRRQYREQKRQRHTRRRPIEPQIGQTGGSSDGQRRRQRPPQPARSAALWRFDRRRRRRDPHRANRQPDVRCRGEPTSRVLVHAPPNDELECRVRTGGKVRGILGQDCRQRVGGRRLVERPAPGQHFVDDRTEAEDVGALVDGAASHLFRGHVSDGSEQHPGSRVGAGHLREPVGRHASRRAPWRDRSRES